MTTLAIPTAAAPPGLRRPLLQLAAIESWRLLRHPAFVLGIVGTMLYLWEASVGEEQWTGQRYYNGATAWGWLWGGTLVAAAAVAGRNRWLDDVDLFPATPVTKAGRITGLLIALAAPVAVATAGAVAAAVWFSSRGGFELGDPGWTTPIDPPLVQWLQVPVLTTLAGVVGIAVAQLPRKRLIAFGVLALVTWVGLFAPWLFGAHPFRVLHPFMYPAYERRLPTDFSFEEWAPGDAPLLGPGGFGPWRAVSFDSTALWWHVGYVVGLALLLVWTAMWLADRSTSRRRLLLLGATIVVACCAGQLVTAGQNW